MNITYQDHCQNIEWERVPELLSKVGMSFTDEVTHRISFEASREVVFAFDGAKLIGCGRAISDGVRQAALYDIAVDPDYQGVGLGKEIVQHLMDKLSGCNFILYASPGKGNFYRKFGFKKMKTGMIFFTDPDRMNDPNFVEV